MARIDRPSISDALAAPPDPAVLDWRLGLGRALAASPQPVARQLALLLPSAPHDPATRQALVRFQRRLDIAHRVHAAYAPDERQPVGDEALAGPGCVGLITLCLLQAGSDCADMASPTGWRLSWLNSAFRALDALGVQDAGLAASWQPVVEQALASAMAAAQP